MLCQLTQCSTDVKNRQINQWNSIGSKNNPKHAQSLEIWPRLSAVVEVSAWLQEDQQNKRRGSGDTRHFPLIHTTVVWVHFQKSKSIIRSSNENPLWFLFAHITKCKLLGKTLGFYITGSCLLLSTFFCPPMLTLCFGRNECLASPQERFPLHTIFPLTRLPSLFLTRLTPVISSQEAFLDSLDRLNAPR